MTTRARTPTGASMGEDGVAEPGASAINVHDLHKQFGHTMALNGLDLAVRVGEVHGLLGPNGSGKSTTIRILLGLLRATSGQAQVLGLDPWCHATSIHRHLAYVPGDVALWPGLTGGEAIDLLSALRGGVPRARRDQLIERLQLDPTRKGHTYSTGNRQKVALVAALAAEVGLLLLDEPTRGLDPLMTHVLHQILLERKKDGQTVLLSSHILSDVEEIADSVTMLRDGAAVRTGNLRELRRHGRSRVRLELRARPTRTELAALIGMHDLVVDDLLSPGPVHCRVTFTAAADDVGDLITALNPHGITAVECAPTSLEELFLKQFQAAP